LASRWQLVREVAFAGDKAGTGVGSRTQIRTML
jgi:hypothetical protein